MPVPQPYEQWLAQARRKYLMEVLTAARFNQCQAAKIMCTHRNTVKRLLVDSGITPAEIRRLRSNLNPLHRYQKKNGAVQHHA